MKNNIYELFLKKIGFFSDFNKIVLNNELFLPINENAVFYIITNDTDVRKSLNVPNNMVGTCFYCYVPDQLDINTLTLKINGVESIYINYNPQTSIINLFIEEYNDKPVVQITDTVLFYHNILEFNYTGIF